VEPGFDCTGEPSVCALIQVCGDGTIQGTETRDDGNTADGDCCSSTCQLQDCSIPAAADSFLRGGLPDANEGANPTLSVRFTGTNRAVVGFDLAGIDIASVAAARLVLTVESNQGNWGSSGRDVSAHALLEDFTEGNGNLLGEGPSIRGSGPGVTFACATDAEIANPLRDCALSWRGGNFAATASGAVLHTNATAGDVQFDVTADIQAGEKAWLIKKTDETRAGGIRYHSREGAALAGDANLAATGARILRGRLLSA
jgi:cysteine-rich repeat protein